MGKTEQDVNIEELIGLINKETSKLLLNDTKDSFNASIHSVNLRTLKRVLDQNMTKFGITMDNPNIKINAHHKEFLLELRQLATKAHFSGDYNTELDCLVELFDALKSLE